MCQSKAGAKLLLNLGSGRICVLAPYIFTGDVARDFMEP